MFYVSCRRQTCCNASSNNCRLCSPMFKCPLRFMASVQRCWRNWLPRFHSEPFIELVHIRKPLKEVGSLLRRETSVITALIEACWIRIFVNTCGASVIKNDDLLEQVLADIAVFWPQVSIMRDKCSSIYYSIHSIYILYNEK